MSTKAARELKARRAREVRASQIAVVDRRLAAAERAAQAARAAAFPPGTPRLAALRTAP